MEPSNGLARRVRADAAGTAANVRTAHNIATAFMTRLLASPEIESREPSVLPDWGAASAAVRQNQRHIPRMRAAMFTSTCLWAGFLPPGESATVGQARDSNSGSSDAGMNRVRAA